MRMLLPTLLILLLVPLTSAQNLGETLQECPGTLVGDNEPSQIHLQMTDDPSEVVVMWATTGRGNAVVEWDGQSSDGYSYCYNHDMAFHMASMTGLTPGEEVTYRVGDGNTWSQDYKFTPINLEANQFEWIAIADHGDSSAAIDVTEGIIADSAAQMVTISGDISYADGEQSVWDSWFENQELSMTKIPWITAVGNHEYEPGYEFTPYEHRFDSDGQIESEIFWFSRNVPGVHMVFMSTEHDYTPGSAQYSWLEQDLTSVNRDVTPFVIVYGHKPMYSSNSYHGSEVELRVALETLYVNQGVDLVIAGHDHFYERTWPVLDELVQNNGINDRFSRGHAPIHLVIGIAGRSSYEELDEPQPEWSAFRENSTYGWTRLVYNGESRELTFTHHRIDGTIGDQFTIQEGVLNENESEGFQFIPGFGTLLPVVALLFAAYFHFEEEQCSHIGKM
ncbi:MAG TPA: metallophosphoesterase family protein [Candidatus Thalassarchaeaceae archaeon]|nr:metallophosphoesterase family protein [Candidatus Thalassarchaeaceae archaeon]HJM19061.1 metallophosphoesterase family protein [Candidatus Thalassarchaeaceae archaeon]HJM86907.1 metallophosphoesterase family protein [Candidatus Thalassarchaeaceae archaeon]